MLPSPPGVVGLVGMVCVHKSVLCTYGMLYVHNYMYLNAPNSLYAQTPPQVHLHLHVHVYITTSAWG